MFHSLALQAPFRAFFPCALLLTGATARAGEAIDADSRLANAFALGGVCTGLADQATVLRFDVIDSADSDALPTILTELRLHGDLSTVLPLTGADFTWELYSPDIDGERAEALFSPKDVVQSSTLFTLRFAADALVFVPNGESRTLELRARHNGSVNGDLPSFPPPTIPQNRCFFTADALAGDVVAAGDGKSSTFEKMEPALFAAPGIRIEKPDMVFSTLPPANVTMLTRANAVVELVDHLGNRLTEAVDPKEVHIELRALGVGTKTIAIADGPFEGLFHFNLNSPANGGGTQDSRLDFSNAEATPGGLLTLRAFPMREGSPNGYAFPVFGATTVTTDQDSTLEGFTQAATLQNDGQFQSIWTARVRDAGTLDNLPTVLKEIAVDVSIGDGCLFNATNFQWQFVSDGVVFVPHSVTPGRVVFRSEPELLDSIQTPDFPVQYAREEGVFEPLLMAQDDESGFFEIFAATTESNAALQQLPIQLSISAASAANFRLWYSSNVNSEQPIGSTLAPGTSIDNGAGTLVVVANPSLPALTCGGEGEGTGDGEGGPEGQGEGSPEGEGEGGVHTGNHSADQDGNFQITLSELLRVIQFYNSARYGCDAGGEDGFAPGATDEACAPHASDYSPQDWRILLSELLRLIQFYNSGGFTPCLDGEDGFCPAPST